MSETGEEEVQEIEREREKKYQKIQLKETDIQRRKNDYLSFNLFVCKYIYILIRTCRKTSLQINRNDDGTVGVLAYKFSFLLIHSDCSAAAVIVSGDGGAAAFFDLRSFHSIKDHIVP